MAHQQRQEYDYERGVVVTLEYRAEQPDGKGEWDWRPSGERPLTELEIADHGRRAAQEVYYQAVRERGGHLTAAQDRLLALAQVAEHARLLLRSQDADDVAASLVHGLQAQLDATQTRAGEALAAVYLAQGALAVAFAERACQAARWDAANKAAGGPERQALEEIPF